MMPRIRLEGSESVVAGGWWLVAGFQHMASTLLRIRALRGVRNPRRVKFSTFQAWFRRMVRWVNASISVFEKTKPSSAGS